MARACSVRLFLCEFSIRRSFFALAASPGTPATCAFCKLVLTLVDEVVQGNRTEAEVAVIAKDFCELNDGAIGYHCKGYVVYCVPPCFHTIAYQNSLLCSCDPQEEPVCRHVWYANLFETRNHTPLFLSCQAVPFTFSNPRCSTLPLSSC